MKLLAEHLEIHFSGCLAHIINLIVKKAFVCFGKIKTVTQNVEIQNDNDNPYGSNQDNLDVLKKLFQTILKLSRCKKNYWSN